jgi:hypothetical protein
MVQAAAVRELHYPVKYTRGMGSFRLHISPSFLYLVTFSTSIRLVLRGHCSSYMQGSGGLWLASHLAEAAS